MIVVVAYDVSTETKEGRRRLRRVAQACKDYGQRVQKSLFECIVREADWVKLKCGNYNTVTKKCGGAS